MDRIILRGAILGLALFVLQVPAVRAVGPAVRLVGPSGQVEAGTIWPVEVRVDTAGLNINAAEIHLSVIGVGTEITRLGRESSILTLWPEVPSINAATAKFVGGRPGGVVAVDALVGTMFVVARQAGPVTINLNSVTSGLYRHDGNGTRVQTEPASLEVQVADDLVPALAITSTTHPTESTWGRVGEIDVAWEALPDEQFSYRLSNDIGVVPDDDIDSGLVPLRFDGLDDGVWYFVIKRRLPGEPWSSVFQRRFLLDRTPPEPFTVRQPASKTVAGRALLTWTALDRTAGVTAYQATVNGRVVGEVVSPLALHPDWRGQTIQIVAIDAAGNQRLSEPWLYGKRQVAMPWWAWTVIGVVFLGLVFEVGRVVRRR